MFGLQSYQGLRIDRSLVYSSYPQDRINAQVIYRFTLAQVDSSALYKNGDNNIKNFHLFTIGNHNTAPLML